MDLYNLSRSPNYAVSWHQASTCTSIETESKHLKFLLQFDSCCNFLAPDGPPFSQCQYNTLYYISMLVKYIVYFLQKHQFIGDQKLKKPAIHQKHYFRLLAFSAQIALRPFPPRPLQSSVWGVFTGAGPSQVATTGLNRWPGTIVHRGTDGPWAGELGYPLCACKPHHRAERERQEEREGKG